MRPQVLRLRHKGAGQSPSVAEQEVSRLISDPKTEALITGPLQRPQQKPSPPQWESKKACSPFCGWASTSLSIGATLKAPPANLGDFLGNSSGILLHPLVARGQPDILEERSDSHGPIK